MTDYDFKEVEFINKNMRYITYNDFVKNHDKIKKRFKEMTRYGRLFFKWYVYANIHTNEYLKNIIWEYLNSDEPQAYVNLISRKQICWKEENMIKFWKERKKKMKNYKVKTKVKNNFNDTKTNITYEKDEDIILDRARYEELLSKGFVEEGKILEDKPLFKKEEKEY